MMILKPSEIFYSQDSVSNRWELRTPYSDTLIGETLDELLTGPVSLDDIPIITAVIINGKLHTADNRRLWVFRKAEEFGYLHEIEVFQESFGIKTSTEDQHQSTYKSSYGKAKYTRPSYVCENAFLSPSFLEDNYFSSIREFAVTDKDILFTTCIRSAAKNEASLRSKSSYEPTLRKGSLHVYGHPVNKKRTNTIQNSFGNKTVTEAQHPNTYKLSYRNHSSCESTVSNKKIEFRTFVRSKAEKEPTLGHKSSFEPTSRKHSFRGYESLVNQKGIMLFKMLSAITHLPRINIKVYTNHHMPSYVCEITFSSPSFRGDNNFSSNTESSLYDKEIQYTTPKAEKEAILRSKSSFEPTFKKTSLRLYDSPVKERGTNAIQYSFGNKTDTVGHHQKTYKAAYGNDKILFKA
ncbi:unnamed protein product [Mytilus coruscus]|uniref:Uncharacterized protein n=1 Tax=Mytilus coruscus TaxID=42192 RepID=A0A6J8CER5_MYTCO|nr:unnamed protein product [Mytilus coruscus]